MIGNTSGLCELRQSEQWEKDTRVIGMYTYVCDIEWNHCRPKTGIEAGDRERSHHPVRQAVSVGAQEGGIHLGRVAHVAMSFGN